MYICTVFISSLIYSNKRICKYGIIYSEGAKFYISLNRHACLTKNYTSLESSGIGYYEYLSLSWEFRVSFLYQPTFVALFHGGFFTGDTFSGYHIKC